MKMLKWALLGGAAFAVTATAAKADELSDLKAQLETLQQRVTQLESQPATSLPSGYSLMTFRSGGAVYDAVPDKADMRQLTAVDNGYTIGVMPTADVAPVAEVTVSGEIRSVLVYDGNDDLRFKIKANLWNDEDEEFYFSDKVKVSGSDDDTLDVKVRGRLVVTGKSDTAVGEVGGRIRLQAGNPFDGSGEVQMNQAYAWWKFSPSWQLIAGLWDSTSAVQAGIDWDFTGPAFTGLLGDDVVEQMRLQFNNGPLTFAVALEDSSEDQFNGSGFSSFFGVNTDGCFHNVFVERSVCYSGNRGNDIGDVPAVTGYIAYDNEGVFLQLTGLWEQDERGFTLYTNTNGPGPSIVSSGDYDDNWFVGAGARFGVGDMATVTAAAFFGEGYQNAVYTVIAPDDQYWGASLGFIANVGEASRLEVGGAYFKNQDALVGFLNNQWAATAGWYWEPVSQVTLFLNGNYAWNEYEGLCVTDGDNCHDLDNNFISVGDVKQNDWQVNFGTYLRF